MSTTTFDEFQKAALGLPVEQRSHLASSLIESLDVDENEFQLHPDWDAELRWRISEAERGNLKTIPHDEAAKRVRESLKRTRQAEG